MPIRSQRMVVQVLSNTIEGRAILKNQCARKMKLYQEDIGKAAIACGPFAINGLAGGC